MKIDPNSSKPLHLQAEEILRRLIEENDYKNGKLLPSETDMSKQLNISLKSATTRLYDTEAKIICIVSKKGAQCIECHHKDI